MQYKLGSTLLRSPIKENENKDQLWQARKIIHQEIGFYTK